MCKMNRARYLFLSIALASGLLTLLLVVRMLPSQQRARLRCAIKAWVRPPRPGAPAQPGEPVDAALVDLKRQVMRVYPEVADPNLSDWERVGYLRAWAYSNIDLSVPPLSLDKRKDLNYYLMDAPTIFSQFAANRGGVCCGGTAYALSKLYEAYGYTSYVVNSGHPATSATHCSTLVEIQHGGRAVLSIQDAYFNVGYVDEAGAPLDYLQMLERLAARRHETVRTITEPRATPPECFQLYPTNRELSTVLYRSWAVHPDNFTLDFLPDGRIRIVSHRCLDRCEELWGTRRAHPFLAREGLPQKTAYLYLFPLSIARSNYVWAKNLLEQAKQCAAGD